MSAREELASQALRLQAGGTLNPRRHVYIERPEDAEALRLLIAGDYVNILSSRQMGKSSLMVRIVRELRAQGVRVATVDLAAEIGSPPDADTFYLSLLRCIARELDVEVALDDWWEGRSSDSVNRRFIDFLQTVILAQVLDPVVVCLDEIDSTLRLSYTDDLFTAIRGIYNQRATSAVFDRLTFCLLGVASPNELIKDRRTTPYNIGTTIELRDFDASRDDLRSLAQHLDPDPKTGSGILERVLCWTDGHPYLTVKLCAELIGAKTKEAVDRFVDAAFTSLDRLSGDAHFQSILRFVETRLADGLTALTLYARILGSQREADRQTIAHAELKLSGLVKRDGTGCLVVRNEIYRRLFDATWAAGVMPARAGRWYRAYAIAASILLVALIAGGGGYYLAKIRPVLQARDDLRASGLDVSYAYAGGGLRVQLPAYPSQADLEKGVASVAKAGHGLVTELALRGTVADLRPVTHLTALTSLDLSQTPIANIEPLKNLTALRQLYLGPLVANLEPLKNLTALRQLDLSQLRVTLGRLISSLPPDAPLQLDPLGTLVANIEPLKNLTALQQLRLSGTQVADIEPLKNLTALQQLDLSGTQVANLEPLKNLTALQQLRLSGTQVADIEPLKNLTALQQLYLSGPQVANIEPLKNLTALQTLYLSGTQVANIEPLKNLTALQTLYLSGTQVANIEPLKNLTALQTLYLSGTQVANLEPLKNLTALERLDLSQTQVANLEPLKNLTALQKLDLSQTQVANITPLPGLTALQELDLTGTRVPANQATKLRFPFAQRDVKLGVTSP